MRVVSPLRGIVLSLLSIATAILTFATAGCTSPGSEDARLPNIVLIFVDDMGTELGCYGNPVIQTPNIDRLAREGLLFERAYTATPSCSASRAALLTGRYPHSNGVQSLIQWHIRAEGKQYPDRLERTRRHALKRSEVVLPQTLKELGYATGIFGKWHLTLDSVTEYGFDEVWAEPEEFIQKHKDRPFFYYHALLHTHVPFWSSPDFRYDSSEVVLPPYFDEDADLRADLAQYYSAISDQDREIGRILDALDNEGLADETIVIFTSDNGPPYARAKATLYEWGVREPLIMRHPGKIAANRRTEALASTVDIYSTLLDLLGQPIPDRLQGKSLLPVLRDPETTVQDAVYCELVTHVLHNPMRSVRSGDWKYIRNFDPDAPFYVGDTTLGLPFLKHPLPVPPRPPEELYRLSQDPLEARNLSDDPEHGAQLNRMRELLSVWMKETADDPLSEMKYVSATESYPGGWFGRPEDPAPRVRPANWIRKLNFEVLKQRFGFIAGVPDAGVRDDKRE